MVRPVPDGYHNVTVTPYLVVSDAARLLDFVQKAFGAKEKMRMPGPAGRIAHAEVTIGDSVIMMGSGEPDKLMPGMIYRYVDDTDSTYKRAVAAGATSVEEPNDAFYGDRRAAVKDATGNHWFIATAQEQVSAEEMQRRMAAMQTPAS